MAEEFNFVSLLLVVVLAFIVPVTLARFKGVPVVVGEILAGILIGPSVLGWVTSEEFVLKLLSEIGFALLMFLSGFEIDFSFLLNTPRSERSRSNPAGLGIAAFLLTICLSLIAGWVFRWLGLARDPWFMALIFSTTSLGIVVPVLKERGLSSGLFGQTVLIAALIADFLTMLLITVYVAFRSTGLTPNLLLIGFLFLAFVFTYQLGVRQLQRPVVRRLMEELSGATTQVKVRGAFVLMISFVVLAESLGLELILGAFLAGAVASLLTRGREEELRSKLDAMGFGFFIPLFFIVVGVRFDLQAFLENPKAWIFAPLMLAFAFLIKTLAAMVFRRRFSWRETLAGGFLLSARLSLIIAAAQIGQELGAISESTNASIILIAALTSTISPLVFNGLLPAEQGKPRRWMGIFDVGDLGLKVARVLKGHGERVCFIEPDPLQAERARREGYPVFQGKEIAECLKNAGEERVQSLLVLSNDDEVNLAVCLAGVHQGIDQTVALVNNPARLPEFRSLGVKVFAPLLYTPDLLALLARTPDILTLLTSTTDDQDVREVHLLNPHLDSKRLSELNLPGSLLVLSIFREGEMLIPHGSTRLLREDRLTVMGEIDDLQAVAVWLEDSASA